MPLVTHFCGVCGCRVPPSDLEVGQAVILNHVTYCRDCAAKAGIETRQAPTGVSPATGRRASASSGAHPAVRPRSASASGGHPAVRRPPAGSRSRTAPARPSGPSRSGNGLVVGGVLAALALVLVVAAFVLLTREEPAPARSDEVRKGPLESLPPPPPEDPGPDETEQASDALRSEARKALADIERLRPSSSAGIPEIREAHRLAAERVVALRTLVESAPRRDATLAAVVGRGEAVADRLAARLDDLAKRVYEEKVGAVRAFVGSKNFDRALRVLNDVPAGFETTRWAGRLQEESAGIESARQNHLRNRATARDEGWTYLEAGKPTDGWTKRGNATWSDAEDPLGYSFLTIRNPGPGDTTIAFDAPIIGGWADYKIRVDLRAVEGDLLIYVRRPGPQGAAGIRMPAKDLPAKDGWWTLQIDVASGLCELRFDGHVRRRVRNPAGQAGGLGFGLPASGSAEIRNVRVKQGR